MRFGAPVVRNDLDIVATRPHLAQERFTQSHNSMPSLVAASIPRCLRDAHAHNSKGTSERREHEESDRC